MRDIDGRASEDMVTFAEETIRSKGKARVRLHTTEDNLPARRLYRSCGYIVRECGERMGETARKDGYIPSKRT